MTTHTRHCHEPVPGEGQNICTRERGHEGDHRCSAADVDARATAPTPVLDMMEADELRELARRVERWAEQARASTFARRRLYTSEISLPDLATARENLRAAAAALAEVL